MCATICVSVSLVARQIVECAEYLFKTNTQLSSVWHGTPAHAKLMKTKFVFMSIA